MSDGSHVQFAIASPPHDESQADRQARVAALLEEAIPQLLSAAGLRKGDYKVKKTVESKIRVYNTTITIGISEKKEDD
jgi:hypothetical protein